MQELLALIIRFGNHLAFIVLEVLCFYLIVSYNDIQRSIFINSAALYTSKVKAKSDEIANYSKLEEVNDSLLLENKRLLETIISSKVYARDNIEANNDAATSAQYRLIPSAICNRSIHLRNNNLTLCSGDVDGIQPLMGVIARQGIVGVVKHTSQNFAHVISLLHSQSRISCEVQGGYSFGNLVWPGFDPQEAKLTGVPRHTSISIGDTVVTSGYSAIFPPGIPVGEISDFKVARGSNEYDINLRLFTDLATISHVYVVDNSLRQEQLDIENE